MIKTVIFLLFLIISPAGLFAAVELDSDDNGATDISKGGTNATTDSGARTALGLAIGTNVQAYDADLGTLAQGYIGTLGMGVASTTTGLLNFYNSGTAYPTGIYSPGAASPSVGIRLPGTMPTGDSFMTADTNGYLGWALQSAFQPSDAQLDTWATVTPSANGQSLVSAATYAAMRTLLDLEPGIDYDASTPSTLATTTDTSISAVQLLANKYITNQGASTEVDNVLPAISYHLTRAIIIEEEQIMEVCPPSGETFELLISGTWTMLYADDCVDSPAIVGSRALVHRMQNASGTWFYSWDTVRGTWSDTGASD